MRSLMQVPFVMWLCSLACVIQTIQLLNISPIIQEHFMTIETVFSMHLYILIHLMDFILGACIRGLQARRDLTGSIWAFFFFFIDRVRVRLGLI